MGVMRSCRDDMPGWGGSGGYGCRACEILVWTKARFLSCNELVAAVRGLRRLRWSAGQSQSSYRDARLMNTGVQA